MALPLQQLFALCSLAVLACTGEAAQPNPLLLISIDGLRWDYPSRFSMNSLLKLADKGVHGMRLKGVFPTVTYPNHWSIVTGKTPEKHGIVANSFYDPSNNQSFAMNSTDEMWWNATLPIWVTAKQQNVSVSVYGWPGSNVVINGSTPKRVVQFNRTASPTTMIDTALGWFQGDNSNMVVLYFPEPDRTAHRTGAESKETIAQLGQMDEHMDYLWKKVVELDLQDRLNIVLLSDHGMTDLSPSRVIPLTKWINKDDLAFFAPGAVAHLVPKEGNELKIYNALKNAHPNMRVYRRAEIPSKFMYRANVRIAPIVVIPDEGWYIALNNGTVSTVGVHGYDNDLDSMKSTFIALGPDFKVGKNITEVLSLDIYPLLCHLLGIKPETHDGDFSKVSCMLKAFPECPASRSPHSSYNRWLMVAVAAVMLACRWSDQTNY